MKKEKENEKLHCIMANCENFRHKSKMYCKDHLDKMRKSKSYKDGDY